MATNSMTNSESNKRIAKNTGMLYIRMLLTMVVSLYTSRIVLNTLGVEDFGIYNVVGGFITMAGFLKSSMSLATQRFLSFEIGRKDFIQLAKVFNMSVNIHVIIALLVLIIAETVGLWFVNTQLSIPLERMEAAKWIYQFSILSFCVSILSVPFDAIIIAYERMNIFAWVSIIEVSLKLLIVIILQWFGFDKLKLYAVLIFGVSLIIGFIYGIYSNRNFLECKLRLLWDRLLFKTLISFSGWNLFEEMAYTFNGQGLNILLNIFFGPSVNAARGITYQVAGAVNSFVRNFQMSINPQIIKSFSSNDKTYMQQLIFLGAKYSFFLLFTITLPILLETETILKLWLKIVPDHTVIFTKLVIFIILIESIAQPLKTAAQATGKIKFYNVVIGGLMLFILPISYLFLKVGFPPDVVFYLGIAFAIVTLFARLLFIQNLCQIKIKEFLKNVLLKIVFVGFVAFIFPLTIILMMQVSYYRFVLVSFASIISTIGTIYLIGLNKNEKDYFLHLVIKERFYNLNICRSNK
jgi:O-antigen/teichoic acid export membrane protein